MNLFGCSMNGLLGLILIRWVRLGWFLVGLMMVYLWLLNSWKNWLSWMLMFDGCSIVGL